jgi:hypothetical protein
MILTPIPHYRVDEVWDRAGPLIEASCRHSFGLETADNLRSRVASGDGCVLVKVDDWEAALILERAGDRLHVVSMGGKNMVRRLDEVVDACWRIASHIGCKGISFRGRKAWARLMGKYGVRDTGDGLMEARK